MKHSITRCLSLLLASATFFAVSSISQVQAAGILTPKGAAHAPIQIKDHHVEVVINNGATSDSQWFEIMIEQQGLSLGTISTTNSRGYAVLTGSPDGRWLVVRQGEHSPPTMLTAVDLKEWRVVGSRECRSPTNNPGFTDAGEYSLEVNGAMEILSLPQLETVRRFKTDTRGSGQIQSIVNVGTKFFFMADRSNNIRRYSIETGNEMPFPPLLSGLNENTTNGVMSGYSSSLIGRRLGEGWISEGVYYNNEKLTAPQLILRPWGFVNTERLDIGQLLNAMDQGNPELARNRRNSTGKVPIQLRGNQQKIMLRDNRHATLSYLDVFEGTEKLQTILYKPDNRIHQPVAAIIGNQLLVYVSDKLYRSPAPADEAARLPESPIALADLMKFKLKQSHLVASSSGVTKLQHTVEGASDSVRFSIDQNVGTNNPMVLPCDPVTGEVTFDARVAVPWMVQHRSKVFLSPNYDQLFDLYLSHAGPEFEKIVGRPPKGIPFAFNIQVRATDPGHGTAVLPYAVFVDIPRPYITDYIVRVNEARQKAVDDRLAAQAEQLRLRQEAKERDDRNQRLGLKRPTRPKHSQEILETFLVAIVAFLVSLPIQALFSSIFLRGVYALDNRLAPRTDKDKSTPVLSWGRALATVSATGGVLLLIGPFLILVASIVVSALRIAPAHEYCIYAASTVASEMAILMVWCLVIAKLRFFRAVRVVCYHTFFIVFSLATVVGTVAGLLFVI